MGIEKWLGYGLLYLALFLLFALIVFDAYKSSLRHKEQVESLQSMAVSLRETRQGFEKSVLNALAALAVQKSLILIESADGNWQLTAWTRTVKIKSALGWISNAALPRTNRNKNHGKSNSEQGRGPRPCSIQTYFFVLA